MKLKNGMIIKCNSKEDAQEFIKEAHKQGFKWINHHEGDEEKIFWCTGESKIYYYLEANHITWNINDDGNESIEYSALKEKKDIMTKSDLKNGMIVQTRNGDKWLVNNGCLLSEEYGCIMIGVYNDEWKAFFGKIPRKMDIMPGTAGITIMKDKDGNDTLPPHSVGMITYGKQ